MHSKINVLLLVCLIGKLTAYTEVEHIDPTYTVIQHPDAVTITLHDIPNMKKNKFHFLLGMEDGKHSLTVRGHTGKKENKIIGHSPHVSLGQEFRMAFVKKIAIQRALEKKLFDVIQPYSYCSFTSEDSKKAALKGVTFTYIDQKMVDGNIVSQLQIRIPVAPLS